MRSWQAISPSGSRCEAIAGTVPDLLAGSVDVRKLHAVFVKRGRAVVNVKEIAGMEPKCPKTQIVAFTCVCVGSDREISN
jgi:hypothetical protein